jgi:hypothetical protein
MLSLGPELRDTRTYEAYNKRNGMAKLVTKLASDLDRRKARPTGACSASAVVQLFPFELGPAFHKRC